MLNFREIAKALIQDAEQKQNAHFDFSNMDKLASQLEELFLIRKRGKEGCTLKNVAEYIKNL